MDWVWSDGGGRGECGGNGLGINGLLINKIGVIMSKINKRNGLESGKRGDRVGVVLDGNQCYREWKKPSNPQTPKQQKHRAYLGMVSRLSKSLSEAVNVGFAKAVKAGSMRSARNVFVSENMGNGALRWDEELGEWEVVWEELVVAKGPRSVGEKMEARVEGRRLRVRCGESNMWQRNAVGDEVMMVAVYGVEGGRTELYEGPLREDCEESEYELSEGLEGEIHVWVWFVATRYHRSDMKHVTVSPGEASRSVYLGRFEVGRWREEGGVC